MHGVGQKGDRVGGQSVEHLGRDESCVERGPDREGTAKRRGGVVMAAWTVRMPGVAVAVVVRRVLMTGMVVVVMAAVVVFMSGHRSLPRRPLARNSILSYE